MEIMVYDFQDLVVKGIVASCITYPGVNQLPCHKDTVSSGSMKSLTWRATGALANSHVSAPSWKQSLQP